MRTLAEIQGQGHMLVRSVGAACLLLPLIMTTPDDLILKEMEGSIPGLSVAVAQRGKVVWSEGYGSAAPARAVGARVTRETAFMFASLSKTVTSTAVMLLRDRGWLAPTDNLNKLLPFPVRNPKYPDTPITLRHLLTHTSSIVDEEYWGLVHDNSSAYGYVWGHDPQVLLTSISEHTDGECRRSGPIRRSLKVCLVETFPMPPLGSVVALGVRRRHAPGKKRSSAFGYA